MFYDCGVWWKRVYDGVRWCTVAKVVFTIVCDSVNGVRLSTLVYDSACMMVYHGVCWCARAHLQPDATSNLV